MLIAGVGRHAKDLLCLLEEDNSYSSLVFFEDINPDGPSLLYDKFRIIRSLEEAGNYFENDNEFVIGIGGCSSRKKIYEKLVAEGGEVITVISETAIIGGHEIELGRGLNVMPYVFISNSVKIGIGTLLNTRSSIHHDVTIGEFCDISPGSTLLGGVDVGDFTQIGSNATVLPNVKIGSHCMVGAGAVVTKDVPDDTVVMGVPAK